MPLNLKGAAWRTIVGCYLDYRRWSDAECEHHCNDRAANAKNAGLENPGIDPGTSHMLSERSTI